MSYIANEYDERHVRTFGRVEVLLEARHSTLPMASRDDDDVEAYLAGACEWLDLRLSIVRDGAVLSSVVERGLLLDRDAAFRGPDGERDGWFTSRHRRWKSVVNPPRLVYLDMVRRAVDAARTAIRPRTAVEVCVITGT